jgi:short-subunit dehydrogenase
MFRFANRSQDLEPRRTVLVTGASGGMGREFARIFASAGNHLVLVARRARELADLADELRDDYHVEVETIALDLSEAGSPEQLYAQLQRRAIPIDILINNAGFAARGRFCTCDVQTQIQLIQLNVTTPTTLTRLLLPEMIQRGRGRILNIASIASYLPGPMMATYFASKSFLLSFSCAIADELKDTGVSVTVLIAGPTSTGFAARAGLEATRAYRGRQMDPRSVARCGYDALMRGSRVAVAGWENKMRMLPLRLMPRRMLTYFARKFHELPGDERIAPSELEAAMTTAGVQRLRSSSIPVAKMRSSSRS